MSGSAANAGQWTDADVYIAPSGTTAPTDVTTAWAVGWDAVGLLDGAEGFTEAQENDTKETYAWGSILVKRSKSKHKRTWKFVALEDNETMFALLNPGSSRSTSGGLTTSTIVAPTNEEFMIGLELRDADTVKRRFAARATIESVGEIKDSEEDVTAYEVTVLLYPEDDGTIYTELKGDA